MNIEAFRILVLRGEGQQIEFKVADADAANIAKAITAMANSGGGTLLIGVGDHGELWGLWYTQPSHIRQHIRTMPDLSTWRQWLVNVSRNNCDPSVPITLEHVVANKQDFLVVNVSNGQDKPYRANGRVYLRIDKEVHEATSQEIAQLFFESGRVQYERLPVREAGLEDLDDQLLRRYFTQARRISYPVDAEERIRLFVNLSLATRLPDRVVPTVAGLLLFGTRPQDHIPAAMLKCAFFYGKHQGEQLRDRADVVGPLPRVIDDGVGFVMRNRRLVPRMEGARRLDIPEYPDYSVREAIANALAHRDWSLDGAKVRLFMFDDRMEIWSPGKLPPPVTLERLGVDQFSRNKIIARVLVELGYIEEIGLGIRRMREEMAGLKLPEPEFREDGSSFVITLRSIAPRESGVTHTDAFRVLLGNGEINERQYLALTYVQDHGTIARQTYVELTGASPRTATRDLADLMAKRLIEVTSGRGWKTSYRLHDSNP